MQNVKIIGLIYYKLQWKSAHDTELWKEYCKILVHFKFLYCYVMPRVSAAPTPVTATLRHAKADSRQSRVWRNASMTTFE